MWHECELRPIVLSMSSLVGTCLWRISNLFRVGGWFRTPSPTLVANQTLHVGRAPSYLVHMAYLCGTQRPTLPDPGRHLRVQRLEPAARTSSRLVSAFNVQSRKGLKTRLTSSSVGTGFNAVHLCLRVTGDSAPSHLFNRAKGSGSYVPWTTRRGRGW